MRVFSTIAIATVLALATSATSTDPRKLDANMLNTLCGYYNKNSDGAITNMTIISTGEPSGLCALPGGFRGHMPAGYSNTLSAMGRWNASQQDLGWDYLEVDGEGSWYHMGVFEGFVTADRIKYVVNTQISAGVSNWVDQHISFIQGKVADNKRDPFWTQVGSLMDQLQGLADGYNLAVPGQSATLKDMFLANFGDEIGDVEIALGVQSGKIDRNKPLAPRKAGSHCSALIKVTDDDLFVAHDTWDTFHGMSHRIFKVYGLNVGSFGGTKLQALGRRISFSAYPATIASGDDWYQILGGANGANRNLAMIVQETTNEVFNTSLYVNVQPQSVAEFLRVMTAMWKANGAEEWTTYFATHNSGTYNNQYMVVDLSKYVPRDTIAPGTFWVAEQIPGYVERGDMSAHLQQYGYWASYNVPYFYHIFDISGYQQQVDEVGTFWSYTKYARPEIFRRNESSIQDIADMMRMMRYNDYKNDVYSIIPNCTGAGDGSNKCDPEHSAMLTIASRGDQMEVYSSKEEMKYHYGPIASFMAQGCFGAIDSKIGSWKNRYTMKSWAISGPTNDQQPTFSYGGPGVMGKNCPTAPAGSPVTFDFPWLEIENRLYSN